MPIARPFPKFSISRSISSSKSPISELAAKPPLHFFSNSFAPVRFRTPSSPQIRFAIIAEFDLFSGVRVLMLVGSACWDLWRWCERSVKMSNADGAGTIAFKGLGMMLTASKQGMAALSGGLNKVRKQYATKHEADVLAELKKKGLRPSDFLFQALQKLDYLSLAGYKHEVTLISQEVAKRLLDAEKSTVPLEMVLVIGGSMSDEALRFGDFQKSSILQGLQEYINMSRMGKDHYDRDTLVHEFYYAILLCSEEIGGDWQQLEAVCKEAVRRVVTMGGAEDANHDIQHKSAKAMFTLASAVKIAAQQEEQRRNKSLRDAEALIQREQQKRDRMLASQSSNSLKPDTNLQSTSTM